MAYDAFISYSHAADERLAPALQSALHRLARPWYRMRACRLFRDKTSLSANPALWPAIERALAESGYLLLLASPEAARSPWVEREVAWWLEHRPGDRLLIALTDGELTWDAAAADFDWAKTTVLPPSLRGRFRDEPLYVDLRWARSVPALSLQHAPFRAAVLDIAATIRGRPKDELDGEDVRQHRLTRSLASAAVVLIVAGAVVAGWQAIVASRERRVAEAQRDLARQRQAEAEEQRGIATAQRDLAEMRRRFAVARGLDAHARRALDRTGAGLELSLLLATESVRTVWTHDGYESWARAASLLPTRQSVFQVPGNRLTAMAVSPDGRWVATGSPAGFVTIRTVEDWREVTRLPLDGGDAQLAAFSPDGRWLVSGQRQELRVWRTSDWRPSPPMRGLWEGSRGAFLPRGPERAEEWVSIAFNSTGTLLLAASAGEGFAWVFALTADGTVDGVAEASLLGMGGSVKAGAFGSTGEWLAVGGSNRIFVYKDLDPTSRPFRLTRNRAPPMEMGVNGPTTALSPVTGDRLLVADNSVHVWHNIKSLLARNQAGLTTESTALEHGVHVRSVSAPPAADWLATGAIDGAAHVWDLLGREIARTGASRVLHGQRAGIGLAGQRLVTGDADGRLIAWSLPATAASAGATLASHATALVANPGGRWVAAGGFEGGTRVYETPTLSQVAALASPASVAALAVSGDGRWLAVTGNVIPQVWRQDPADPVRGLPPPKGAVTVRVWRTSDWTAVAEHPTPAEGAALTRAALTFSPDARWLAAVSSATVHMVPVPGGERVLRLRHDAGTAEAVSFSPDGRFVAIHLPDMGQSRPPTTRVFELSGGTEVASTAHKKDLKAWPRTEIRVTEHKSPDEQWQINQRGQLRDPTGEPRVNLGALTGFAFLDGGRWLASVSERGNVVNLWPLRLADIVDGSCRRLGRNLRQAEWKRYVGDADYQPTCPDLPVLD